MLRVVTSAASDSHTSAKRRSTSSFRFKENTDTTGELVVFSKCNTILLHACTLAHLLAEPHTKIKTQIAASSSVIREPN